MYLFSGGDGAMVNGTSDPGVTDMVTISNIDEHVINKNLKKRYTANRIYVSVTLRCLKTPYGIGCMLHAYK